MLLHLVQRRGTLRHAISYGSRQRKIYLKMRIVILLSSSPTGACEVHDAEVGKLTPFGVNSEMKSLVNRAAHKVELRSCSTQERGHAGCTGLVASVANILKKASGISS